MGREEMLTTLEASQILEAIHNLIEQKKRYEEENLDLLIKVEGLEFTIRRMTVDNLSLKSTLNDEHDRVCQLTTRVVELQEAFRAR